MLLDTRLLRYGLGVDPPLPKPRMTDLPQQPDPPADARAALQRVLDHCNRGWTTAHAELERATLPLTAHLAGKKNAYNNVFQFAQALLRSLP